MTYLLDTNAVSDLMARRPLVLERTAAALAGDRVVTCPIVVGELKYGLARLPVGRRRTALEQRATEVLSLLESVPVPVVAAEHYATAKVHRQTLGVSMDENDLWVLAVARSLDAVLVTRDQDFQVMPGIRLEDWSS